MRDSEGLVTAMLDEHFAGKADGGFYRQCKDCRAVGRAAYRRRRGSVSTSESDHDAHSSRPAPFLHISQDPDNLDDQCLSSEVIDCIHDFHAALNEERQETCENCNERWFGMNVQDGLCARCRSSGHLWGADNHMDPGKPEEYTVTSMLTRHLGPSLQELCRNHGMGVPDIPSQVEEMLLSRYHVFLQTWRVHGGQMKYSGHTCLYTQDNGRFINRLPLTVTELDIPIIRSAGHENAADTSNFARRPEFQVNRARVLENLRALKRFHPDYHLVAIDLEALDLLPQEGSIFNQLRTVAIDQEADFEVTRSNIDPEADGMQEDGHITEGVIPNIDGQGDVMDEARHVLGNLIGDATGANKLSDQGLSVPLSLRASRLVLSTSRKYSRFRSLPPPASLQGWPFCSASSIQVIAHTLLENNFTDICIISTFLDTMRSTASCVGGQSDWRASTSVEMRRIENYPRPILRRCCGILPKRWLRVSEGRRQN